MFSSKASGVVLIEKFNGCRGLEMDVNGFVLVVIQLALAFCITTVNLTCFRFLHELHYIPTSFLLFIFLAPFCVEDIGGC